MTDEIERAFTGAGVTVAYLFGSRATGRATQRSDADVAVLCERPLGLRARGHLANALADALGVTEVDLVVLEEAPLELRGRVVQEGRLIYSSDEPRRVAFEVRTRSEYFDFLPYLEELTRRYLRKVADRGL